MVPEYVATILGGEVASGTRFMLGDAQWPCPSKTVTVQVPCRIGRSRRHDGPRRKPDRVSECGQRPPVRVRRCGVFLAMHNDISQAGKKAGK